MKKIAPLILTLFAFNASAIDIKSRLLDFQQIQEELKCSTEYKYVASAFKVKHRETINCSDVDWAEKALSKVANLKPDAPMVNLELLTRDNGASFDIGETVRIPLHLTFTNQWGQVFNSYAIGTDAILYHEYSHAIFGKRIGKLFYPKLKALAERLSRFKIYRQKAYAEGNPRNVVEYYTKQIESIEERVKTHNELEKYHLSSPYNELFADLMAVLVTNNRNAIFNALYYDEMTDEAYQLIKLRSFEDQNTKYDNRGLYEEHGELALVRQYIGEEILPKIFKNKNEEELKKELIKIVLDSIEAQMDERIRKNAFKISPMHSNTSLIEEIKQRYLRKTNFID
ncbi:hypothetical protein M902_0885 [Bacteriovorax sp. BAL6_X]|uniref:hypothetical protein n=1 Tax=Bacteriovorax sp. BAL6_X TaxID=1201290 RepID=UPI000385912B|nr:hypothetical protein [Bacteriovorax sp. BAL6_X]EPZ49698.1 hypothetical protein M902_0885 [Bacteriovorax sp. BAL6_X]